MCGSHMHCSLNLCICVWVCRPWETQGDSGPPVPCCGGTYDWSDLVRFIKLLSTQSPDLQGELMNHVKGVIFHTWPPVRKNAGSGWRSTDPWLQGSLCHLLCQPTSHYNATLKLILCELSFCVDSFQGTERWPSSFFGTEFMWLNPHSDCS